MKVRIIAGDGMQIARGQPPPFRHLFQLFGRKVIKFALNVLEFFEHTIGLMFNGQHFEGRGASHDGSILFAIQERTFRRTIADNMVIVHRTIVFAFFGCLLDRTQVRKYRFNFKVRCEAWLNRVGGANVHCG